jgi:hypothetical protein
MSFKCELNHQPNQTSDKSMKKLILAVVLMIAATSAQAKQEPGWDDVYCKFIVQLTANALYGMAKYPTELEQIQHLRKAIGSWTDANGRTEEFRDSEKMEFIGIARRAAKRWMMAGAGIEEGDQTRAKLARIDYLKCTL